MWEVLKKAKRFGRSAPGLEQLFLEEGQGAETAFPVGLVAAGGNFPVGQAQAVAQALAPGLLYPLGQLGQARFQVAPGAIKVQPGEYGTGAGKLLVEPLAAAGVFPGHPRQIVAALVEAFWSAIWLPPAVKYMSGALCWALVIAYFTLAGRGYAPTDD